LVKVIVAAPLPPVHHRSPAGAMVATIGWVNTGVVCSEPVKSWRAAAASEQSSGIVVGVSIDVELAVGGPSTADAENAWASLTSEPAAAPKAATVTNASKVEARIGLDS